MKKSSTIIIGILFIIAGGIVGLNSFGITDIHVFFDGWWALFIIIPAVNGIISDDDKLGSIIWLIVGLLLLSACQNFITFDLMWKLLLPLGLIFIGFSIMIGDKDKKGSKKVSGNEFCACFSGQNIKFDDQEFKGSEVNAIFGGVTLDLRNAKIKDGSVIEATAIFGGVTILVPEDLKIEVKSTSIFGGVNDKTKYNKKKDKTTVYVNGCSIFGGVEIK